MLLTKPKRALSKGVKKKKHMSGEEDPSEKKEKHNPPPLHQSCDYRGIYRTLQRMGFTKGNLLEPSMGIGNFFGMLPETMRESHLYGVELDDLTGRIARQLYPKADITVDGYEKQHFRMISLMLLLAMYPLVSIRWQIRNTINITS